MADENMMEMDELGDEEEEASGGKSPIVKYLPWIIGVLVVQVLLVYFVAKWFFAPAVPEDPAAVTEVVKVEAEPVQGEEGDQYQPPPLTVGVIFDKLDVIVVNPAGTDGLRFLSTQVTLGLASGAVEAHITANNLTYRMYDTLVRIFSGKTIPDLDPSKHDKLKEEIKTKLNAFLGKNAVLEVYFKSFVLQ